MDERIIKTNQTAISQLISALLNLKDDDIMYEHLREKGTLDKYVYEICSSSIRF